MSQPHIIRLRLVSSQEMGFVGNAFGTYFLKPLIQHTSSAVNQPVIALYGQSTSGKSTFVMSATRFLHSLYKGIKGSSHDDHCDGMTYLTEDKAGSPQRICRHKDFGYSTLAPPFGPGARHIVQSEFLPRRELSHDRPTPGFDVLEHPTYEHLNGAHVVVIIGRLDMPVLIQQYFARMENHILHAVRGKPNTEKRSAHKVASELYTMQKWMHERARAELSSTPRALTPPTLQEGFRWLRACLTHRPGHREERLVTILLTSQNPDIRQTFDNFRQKIPQNLAFG